jgi:hypothetical protein
MLKYLDYHSRRSGSHDQVRTLAVCTIGIGTEDMTSYFLYQNLAGVEFQNEGFRRVLPVVGFLLIKIVKCF